VLQCLRVNERDTKEGNEKEQEPGKVFGRQMLIRSDLVTNQPDQGEIITGEKKESKDQSHGLPQKNRVRKMPGDQHDTYVKKLFSTGKEEKRTQNND